jgi:hypothetical protein
VTTNGAERHMRRLTTPRAAAFAGVLFALLFATALILIRLALPEGAAPGSQWLDVGSTKIRISTILIPFAGISFLWFIGVVRDGFGTFEDKFFSSVFFGSGILFLAMIFAASAVGAGLVASAGAIDGDHTSAVATLGRMTLMALTKTYALRMGAVFMMSLATIWLRTGLMPRWLVIVTYVSAIALLIVSDVSMWIALAFPIWVLVVSLLVLVRAGVIDLPHHEPEEKSVL